MMNKRSFCVTIPKLYQNTTNEDAAIKRKDLIAISDGAGGYGILADKWSEYLLEHLPNNPIKNFNEFDNWLGAIWKEFYDRYEPLIKEKDAFIQNKFYEEGSCATLIAVWQNNKKVNWIQYGDSAIFIYNKSKKKFRLKSPESISEFLQNPRLINWKDNPSEKYFKIGEDIIDKDDVLIIASDALSCYLLLSYIVSEKRKLKEDEKEILSSHLEQYYNALSSLSISSYFNDVLLPLINAAKSKKAFHNYIKELFENKYIASDDYSFACIELYKTHVQKKQISKQGKLSKSYKDKLLNKFLDIKCQ